MSAEIIDISQPLEERKFKNKESRLQALRNAFKAARLDAQAAKKKTSSRQQSGNNKKKSKKPTR
ncbi:MAG: hypothetical protein V4751_08255 [Pseudomonadota bacterium]